MGIQHDHTAQWLAEHIVADSQAWYYPTQQDFSKQPTNHTGFRLFAVFIEICVYLEDMAPLITLIDAIDLALEKTGTTVNPQTLMTEFINHFDDEDPPSNSVHHRRRNLLGLVNAGETVFNMLKCRPTETHMLAPSRELYELMQPLFQVQNGRRVYQFTPLELETKIRNCFIPKYQSRADIPMLAVPLDRQRVRMIHLGALPSGSWLDNTSHASIPAGFLVRCFWLGRIEEIFRLLSSPSCKVHRSPFLMHTLWHLQLTAHLLGIPGWQIDDWAGLHPRFDRAFEKMKYMVPLTYLLDEYEYGYFNACGSEKYDSPIYTEPCVGPDTTELITPLLLRVSNEHPAYRRVPVHCLQGNLSEEWGFYHRLMQVPVADFEVTSTFCNFIRFSQDLFLATGTLQRVVEPLVKKSRVSKAYNLWMVNTNIHLQAEALSPASRVPVVRYKIQDMHLRTPDEIRQILLSPATYCEHTMSLTSLSPYQWIDLSRRTPVYNPLDVRRGLQ